MSGLSGWEWGCLGVGPRLQGVERRMGGRLSGQGAADGWGLKDGVPGSRLVATCITVM
jgi:hypothetical protein